MTAVGIVLLSAALLGTIKASDLMIFTGYSSQFISAITLNMRNNNLWIGGRYDHCIWLSQEGTIEKEGLWEHIDIACGTLWMPEADTAVSADPCEIYWDEQGGLKY